MPKLLLSFDLHGELGDAHRQWVVQWVSLLRQRGLKAMVAVSCDAMLAVEKARAFDLLDALSWHEHGLYYVPGTSGAPEPTGNQQWWQERLDTCMQQMMTQIIILKRLLGHAPVAITTDLAHYAPQVGLVASRQGIPILAHAPFEDKARGTILDYSGCGYLCRHLTMDALLAGKVSLKRWKQDCDAVFKTIPDDGYLVVGCDLTSPLLCKHADTLNTQSFELIAAYLYELAAGEPGSYQQIRRSSSNSHLQPVEVTALSREMTERLRPLRLGARWLSLCELFSVFVQAGHQCFSHGEVVERIYPQSLLGPLSPPPEFSEILVRRGEIWAACADLAAELVATGRIPSVVDMGGKPVSPSSFMFSLAQTLHHEKNALVKIPKGPLPQFYATNKEIRLVADTVAELADGPVARLIRNAILCQCWTARPY